MMKWLRRFLTYHKFGIITAKVVGTAGDQIAAEIEYIDCNGDVCGFWAYGSWHPDLPFQGHY